MNLKFLFRVTLLFCTLLITVKAYAQHSVYGTVRDTTGSVLPGVSVGVKGKANIGTVTDMNGKYVLEVPPNTTLTFSMVGFDVREMEIGSRTVVDVVLTPSANELDDVVVVAFGTQKKKEVVGSVTTITPSELKVPSSNLTTALAGRLAGVVAYQRSGEPGQDNADFFVRGVTTFGYKKDPLILVDGVEFTTTDLARMQVDDIASFSILKDASSTALYGARGANGIILITTKQGTEASTKLSLRIENSVSAPTREVELADPITYMRLNNEAVLTRNPEGEIPYLPSKIDNTLSGVNPYVYPAVDWMNMLFKKYAVNQRANMNISGGGNIARYYMAATFNQDNGVLNVDGDNNFNNNINLKTYGLRANIDANITKSTTVAVKLYGTFDDYTGPIEGGSEYYKLAIKSDPVSFPAFYPKNEQYAYLQHIMFGNTSNELVNPYAELVKGYKEYNRSLMLAQFDIKQDLSFITQGLNVQALFNIARTSYFDVSRSYSPFWYQIGSYDKINNTYTLESINEATGQEYLGYQEGPKDVRATTYIQGTTNYNRTFGEVHSINAMLVFLMQNQRNGNAGSLQTSLPYRNLGLSGRFNYAYNERYFAEFDFGYNGSERFHESKRFGFFPSFGLGWQVSNESFFKPFTQLFSNLKLRGTYGIIGNDAIGTEQDRFFYLSDINMDDSGRGAVFGFDNSYHRNGVTVRRYDNPLITWEKSYKTNIGMDIGILNKVNVIVDFWKEKRTQILMDRADIPITLGLNPSSVPKANVGEAEGKGIDGSVDYSQSFSNGFWIQGRANFTYALSKFLVYEEPQYESAPWKSRVGYPITQRWGYIAERLFIDDLDVANSPVQNFGEATRGGDIKYRDINKDGQITTLDQVPIGFPTSPNIVYGFGLSMGFKGVDFSCFFQGLSQESFWIDVGNTSPFATSIEEGTGRKLKNQLLQAYAEDFWSESNRNPYALWPRLSTNVNPNNSQPNTWFMRDGTFLRLKSAEVGYTFRDELLKKIHFSKLRVYTNGTNLLCWSKFKLWDVEMAGNGLGYPVQRVFNVGLQASF